MSSIMRGFEANSYPLNTLEPGPEEDESGSGCPLTMLRLARPVW